MLIRAIPGYLDFHFIYVGAGAVHESNYSGGIGLRRKPG